MEAVAKDIIEAAHQGGIPLEINISSMRQEYLFWKQFWEMVPYAAKGIVGFDAHDSQSSPLYMSTVRWHAQKDQRTLWRVLWMFELSLQRV